MADSSPKLDELETTLPSGNGSSVSSQSDGVVWEEPLDFVDMFENRAPEEGDKDAASGPVPQRAPVDVPRDKVQIRAASTGGDRDDEVNDVLVKLPSANPTDETVLAASVTRKKSSEGPTKGVWALVITCAALAGLLVWVVGRRGRASSSEPADPTTKTVASASEPPDVPPSAVADPPQPDTEPSERPSASVAPPPAALMSASNASPVAAPRPPPTVKPPPPPPPSSDRVF